MVNIKNRKSMDKEKQSCKEFQKIAANFGLSTKELMENIQQLQKPDLIMDIKNYEIEEAMEWWRKAPSTTRLTAEDLARYGRRLYNQAINDAVNTAENQSMVGISGKEVKTIIVNKIKKLER